MAVDPERRASSSAEKLTTAKRFFLQSRKKTSSIGIQLMIDYFARIFIPVVIVIFNILYWGRAMKNGQIEV